MGVNKYFAGLVLLSVMQLPAASAATVFQVTTLEEGLAPVQSSQSVIFQAPDSPDRFYTPTGQTLPDGSIVTGTSGTGIELSCANGSGLFLSGAFELQLLDTPGECAVELTRGSMSVVSSNPVRVFFGGLEAASSGGIFMLDYGLDENEVASQLAVLSGSATLNLEGESYPLDKGGKYVISNVSGLVIADVDNNDLAKTADRLARIRAANTRGQGLNGDDAVYSYTALRRQYLEGFVDPNTAAGGVQGTISPVENYALGVELTAETEELYAVQGTEPLESDFTIRQEMWDLPVNPGVNDFTIDSVNNIEVIGPIIE